MIKIDFRTELHKVRSVYGWVEPNDDWVITNLPTLKDLHINVSKDLPKQMKYSKFYNIVSAENHRSFKRQLQYMLYTKRFNDTFVETVARCIMFNKDVFKEVCDEPGASYFMYPAKYFDGLFDTWKEKAPEIIDMDDKYDKDYDKDYWITAITEALKKIATDELKAEVREYLSSTIDNMLVLPETHKSLLRYTTGGFKDKIQVIVGAAGSGKSFMSRQIIEHMRQDGKAQNVYVVSLPGCRAEEFVNTCHEKGIENVCNYSYAKFRSNHLTLNSNDLVIFEEVSQFDQTHLDTILNCADICDVIVNGDYLQCASFLNTGPLISLFGGFCPISPGGEVHKCKNIKFLTEPYRPVSASGKEFFRKSREYWDNIKTFKFKEYSSLFDNKTFAFTWDAYEADIDPSVKKHIKETLGDDYKTDDKKDKELLNFLMFAVTSYRDNMSLFKIVNGEEKIGFCGIFNNKDLVCRAQELLNILFKRLYNIDTNQYLMSKTTFKTVIKKKHNGEIEEIPLTIYSGTKVEFIDKSKDNIITLRYKGEKFKITENDLNKNFQCLFVSNTYKSQGNEYMNVYALHKPLKSGVCANNNYVQDTRAKEKYVADFNNDFVNRTYIVFKQF